MEFRTGTKRRGQNEETILNSKEFYERDIIQKIDIREMGVEALNDFMGHLSRSVESKHEEGTKEAIKELKSVMRGQHIARNLAGKLKILGPLSGGISKKLIHGKERRKSAVGWGIAK